MDSRHNDDEFERIKVHQDMDRARHIIDQYESGLAFYRKEVERHKYELGRLDERLETAS